MSLRNKYLYWLHESHAPEMGESSKFNTDSMISIFCQALTITRVPQHFWEVESVVRARPMKPNLTDYPPTTGMVLEKASHYWVGEIRDY
jgi:hypothetical protein